MFSKRNQQRVERIRERMGPRESDMRKATREALLPFSLPSLPLPCHQAKKPRNGKPAMIKASKRKK